MSVLPDTSVWIDYLRRGQRGRSAALDSILQRGEAVVCGPVVAELLAGAAASDRDELWSLLASLPWAEIGRAQWRRAGEVAAALRERGTTAPLTDIEIAVAAADADAELWTRDSDFDRIVGVLPGLRRYPE